VVVSREDWRGVRVGKERARVASERRGMRGDFMVAIRRGIWCAIE
jgi:hypothetical protein